MITITNPVGKRFSIALNNHNALRSQLMKAATSGRKQDITVIDAIIGAKARSATDFGKKIIAGMGTGFNITNIANISLKNLRGQIEEIKQEILALNNADPYTLETAEVNYNRRMERLFTILKTTNFAGKNLFDGTLAKIPVMKLPSQSLPTHATPLRVQAGISFNDNIDVIIPRIMPGDGTILNVPVDGVFSPLFSVTDNTRAALNNLNAVAEVPNEGTEFFRDQRSLIVNAIPDGVNAEQDLINQITLETYHRIIQLMVSRTGDNVNTALNARIALRCAKSAGNTITLSTINSDDINKAHAFINNVINSLIDSAPVPNILAAQDAVDNIPHDGTVSYAQQVLQAIAASCIRIPAALDNGENRLKGVREVLRRHIGQLQRPFPNSIYIGSVKTSMERIAIIQRLEELTSSIDSITSNIISQRNILSCAKSNLEALVPELDNAANNYLNANYEDIISALMQLMRETRMASLAHILSERALNAILSKLEEVAMIA